MVTVVKTEPHPSVVKETICRNCGVTLNYVPADAKVRTYKDYSGTSDTEKTIQCPACHHEVYVR